MTAQHPPIQVITVSPLWQTSETSDTSLPTSEQLIKLDPLTDQIQVEMIDLLQRAGNANS